MSTTTYPTSLDAVPPKITAAIADNPELHQRLHVYAQDLLVAIIAELGTNPSGAQLTLSARLAAIDATDVSEIAATVVAAANATKALFLSSGAAPTIASDTTIAPTTPIFFISGVVPVETITPPAPIATLGGALTLIPAADANSLTFLNTGNIAATIGAVTVGVAITLVYDPVTALWYPSFTN